MRYTIFNEIKTALISTNEEVRLILLKQINQYIKSCNWDNKKENAQKLISTIGMTSTKASDTLGITVNNYKVSLKRASDKIRNIIGNNIIEEIQNCKLEELPSIATNLKISIGNSKIEDYFIDEIKNLIPFSNIKEYNTDDLTNEIQLLRSLTRKYIEDKLEGYDKDKLGYIMSVLTENITKEKTMRGYLFKEIIMNYNK